MNVFQAIAVFLSAGSVFLGVLVARGRVSSRANALFTVSCALGALTMITYPLIWWNPDRGRMEALSAVNLSIVMFNFSVILLFVLEFARAKVGKGLACLVFVPAMALTATTFVSTRAFSGYVWTGSYWTAFPPYGGLGGLAFVAVFYLLYPAVEIAALTRWAGNSRLRRERRQAAVILFSLLSLFAGSFIADFALHLVGLRLFAIGPLFGIPYLCGFFYCLARHQFLVFDVNAFYGEMIAKMDEFLVMLDSGGRIVKDNPLFRARFGDAGGEEYASLIDDADGGALAALGRVLKGEAETAKARHFVARNGRRAFVESFMSRLTDSSGDTFGVSVVSRELPGAAKLIEEYGLTARQFQITRLVVGGLSNKDLGARLGLSRRTVETHVSNIYCKLSVRNRAELLRICRKYRVL